MFRREYGVMRGLGTSWDLGRVGSGSSWSLGLGSQCSVAVLFWFLLFRSFKLVI